MIFDKRRDNEAMNNLLRNYIIHDTIIYYSLMIFSLRHVVF